MEKLTIRTVTGEEIEFDADYYLQEESKIDDVIAILEDLRSSGATHIEWTGVTDSDGCSTDVLIQGYSTRLENDEEYSVRMKSVENEKLNLETQSKKRELSEYRRLKRKFEGG